jgi:hypothetical protein
LRLGGLGRGFAIVLAVESIDRSVMAMKSQKVWLHEVLLNTITQCKVKISQKAFVAVSEMQPLTRLRKLLANNWILWPMLLIKASVGNMVAIVMGDENVRVVWPSS